MISILFKYCSSIFSLLLVLVSTINNVPFNSSWADTFFIAENDDDEWKKFQNSSWHNFKFVYRLFCSWKRKFHFSDSDINDIIFVRWEETWFMLRCYNLMVKFHVDHVDLRFGLFEQKKISILIFPVDCECVRMSKFLRNFISICLHSDINHVMQIWTKARGFQIRSDEGESFFETFPKKNPIKTQKSLNLRRMLSCDELRLSTEFVAKCAINSSCLKFNFFTILSNTCASRSCVPCWVTINRINLFDLSQHIEVHWEHKINIHHLIIYKRGIYATINWFFSTFSLVLHS